MFRVALLVAFSAPIFGLLALRHTGSPLLNHPLFTGRPQLNVGDSVTLIRDSELKADNHVVQTVGAGATFTIKQIDGSLLLIEADALGWVPAENVVAADKAAAYFADFISRAPNDPRGYYWRGGLLQSAGQYDQAIEDYDRAIRLSPKESAYRVERGACYLQKKDYSRAVAGLTDALKLDPKAMSAYLGRAGAFCEMGEYARAMADIKTAIRLQPKLTTPRANLAELLACCPEEKFRDGQKALKLATEVCEETEWKNPQLLHYLACANAECGDFEAAVKTEKDAIALNPADGDLENLQKALAAFESRQPLREFLAFGR